MTYSRILATGATALLALFLAGCATVTPYQPMTDGQGYAEQRIEPNRFRVSFAGNSSTPRETVENYLLFRATELTLLNGYDYFVMTGTDTEAQTRYSQSISAFGGTGWYSRYSGLGIGVGTSTPITEYQAQAFVTMFKGQKPAGSTDAFDAREVRNNIGPTVRYPEPR